MVVDVFCPSDGRGVLISALGGRFPGKGIPVQERRDGGGGESVLLLLLDAVGNRRQRQHGQPDLLLRLHR